MISEAMLWLYAYNYPIIASISASFFFFKTHSALDPIAVRSYGSRGCLLLLSHCNGGWAVLIAS